jgi:hypothetical protein
VYATPQLGFAEMPAEWNGQPRGLVRYDPGTGAVLWSAPLPCRPGQPAEADGRLVVPCGWESGGAGLLLFLDPGSGEVLETLEAPSPVSSIYSAADTWVLVTDDAVVAVDPTRRALPRAKTEPVDEAVDRILKGIRHTSPLVHPGDVESLLALGSAAWPTMTDRLPATRLAAAVTLAQASIRDAIRRHLEWFGSGEGPTAVCSLGSSWPETLDQAREDECLSIRIEEVDAVEGAREIADRLPLGERERRYVVEFEPGWRVVTSLYRVRPIGDRWLVRSVWNWVS